MKNQTKLYEAGFKPVFKIVNKQGRELRPWQFIPSPVKHQWFEEEEIFNMKFHYVFSTDSSNVIYFAYSFPFTFLEMTRQLDAIEHTASR